MSGSDAAKSAIDVARAPAGDDDEDHEDEHDRAVDEDRRHGPRQPRDDVDDAA